MSLVKKLGIWSIVGAISASYLALLVGKIAYQIGALDKFEIGKFIEGNSFALSFPFPNDLFTILFSATNNYPVVFGILLVMDVAIIFIALRFLTHQSNRTSIACVAGYWVLSLLAFVALVPLGIVMMMSKGHP